MPATGSGAGISLPAKREASVIALTKRSAILTSTAKTSLTLQESRNKRNPAEAGLSAVRQLPVQCPRTSQCHPSHLACLLAIAYSPAGSPTNMFKRSETCEGIACTDARRSSVHQFYRTRQRNRLQATKRWHRWLRLAIFAAPTASPGARTAKSPARGAGLYPFKQLRPVASPASREFLSSRPRSASAAERPQALAFSCD